MSKAVESALDDLLDDLGDETVSQEPTNVEVESIERPENYPRTQADVMQMTAGTNKDISSFTPEQRTQLAHFYTQQIRVSLFQTAIALMTMQSLNLFNDLGYDTFQLYVEEECGMSYRKARELISAVEDFGNAGKMKELMEASPKKFLQAVRDTRNKQLEGETLMLSDGTEVSAEDYIAERISQLESSSRKRIKDLERDIKNTRAVAEYSESEKEKLKRTIEDKNKKINALAKSKKLDPDRIQKLAEQRDAEDAIQERVLAIDKALRDMIDIPHEVRSNSLGFYITKTLATLEITLKQVRMDWGAYIVAGETEDNG